MTLRANALVSLPCFSTLQRVEIAEIERARVRRRRGRRFSTLQRVEIAEISSGTAEIAYLQRFSTLQRVEIAEMNLLR